MSAPAASRPLRVLLVTDEMEVGGTQRQIVHIARAIDRARFRPEVAYFRNRSFLAEQLADDGIPVTEIPKRGRFDVGFVRALAAFVRRGRYDVMHCFAFSGELWGSVARRLVPAAERPALITSVRNKYDWYSGLQWSLKGWTARQSCRVVANSQSGARYALEKMRMPGSAMHVVYNGVAEPADAARLSVPLEASAGPLRLQFVGRLVEQKNVFVLLRAMQRLAAANLDVKLRIAGDGPLRPAIEAELRERALADRVELLGERSDVAALMSAADAVVLPSFREGLSNVILEAMMLGRPVIASDVGGNGELVEPNATGLLFPSDDDAALAAAITTLSRDRALRLRMGSEARQRALSTYTVPAMAAAMENHYLACARRAEVH
jgi:glycosyltransferase involved in cell wall biosynthesis